jgi:hypothetical protein
MLWYTILYALKAGRLIELVTSRLGATKHVLERKIEGSLEVTGRRGRRTDQLLDDLKETREQGKLKEKVRNLTLSRTRFKRDY